jgi:sugar fermentation stimulation protein A
MVQVATNLEEAIFEKRLNRFVGEFKNIRGEIHQCHILNPGRMKEFLIKGVKILVENRGISNPNRKIPYSLIFVIKDDILIGIDSILPNKIFEEALQKRIIKGFENYNEYKREKNYGIDGKSKIDFFIDKHIFVEIKSTNCVFGEQARFPDAPSIRAQKHLKELIHELEKGMQAYVVFIVKRSDAKSIRSYDEIDPEFGILFRKALNIGLKCIAFTIDYFDSGKQARIGNQIVFQP